MIQLDSHTSNVLKVRYLLNDETTLEDVFSRVAKDVAKVEKDADKWEKEYYDVMASQKFIPNSPLLWGAGTSNSPFACYVLGVEDTRGSIFECLKDAVEIESKGGGCFTRDVDICTSRGYVSIDEVKVGDMVLTDGAEWHPVVESMKREYVGSMLKVKVLGVREFTATPEHPILVAEKDLSGEFNLKWKKMENLSVKDLVCIPRLKGSGSYPSIIDLDNYAIRKTSCGIRRVVVNESFAWFLGMYLAEGFCSIKDKRVTLCLGTHEVELIKKLKDILSVMGFKSWDRVRDGSIEISFSSRLLGRYLEENIGKGAINKRLPSWIFDSSESMVRSFLLGYFDGDGCVHNNSKYKSASIGTKTSSKSIVCGIQILLSRFGLRINLNKGERKQETIVGRKVKKVNPYYTAVSDTQRIVDFLGYGAMDRERRENVFCQVGDDYLFVPVRKIKAIDYKGFVYNLRVLDNNTYTVNNLVVHNCGFNFSKLRPKGALIGSTGGAASGPMSFMEVFDKTMGEVVKQGKRGGAMMAVLWYWHPDIEKYITAKQDTGCLSHFNISVMVDDKFMRAVEADDSIELFHPKGNGSPNQGKKISARQLWQKLCKNSWQFAEPGLLFYDNANRDKLADYDIETTNPCVTGDTLIAVADGRNAVSMKQLAEEGKDVPVYCVDPNTGSVHIRHGRNPRKTGKNTELVEVVFDDGGVIRVTPNHKIVKRNGINVEAKDLVAGDSILSMTRFEYCSGKGRYYGIVNGDGKKTKQEHVMIREFIDGTPMLEDEVVHHVDFNGKNNSPENISRMKASSHSSYHRGINNPMTHWYPNTTPEERKKYHDRMSASVSGARNGMAGKKHSEETLRKIGEKTVERFGVAGYTEKISAAIKSAYNSNPELRNNLSVARRQYYDRVGRIEKGRLECVCEWCGKTSVYFDFADKVRRFCSRLCIGEYAKENNNEIIGCFEDFVKRNGEYPSLAGCEEDGGICSRETVRTRFGDFQKLSEILVDRGVFARVKPNTKMTKKIVAGAFVDWTTRNGRLPTVFEAKSEICSRQTIKRLGGYDEICKNANELAMLHSVNHKVVSVRNIDEKEDVYNITVDDFHNYCIQTSTRDVTRQGKDVCRQSYIVSKNCGEQFLPPDGICDLGHINLAKLVDENTGKFDMDEFRRLIHLGVRFLDDVIDMAHYPIERIKAKSISERRIGLGLMGFADACILKNIRYGSDKCRDFIDKIGKFWEEESIKASELLAKEKGSSEYVKRCCDKRGIPARRNICLRTIAPTGTCGMFGQCSGGTEPNFEFEFKRNDTTGTSDIVSPILKQKSNKRIGSDVWVTAHTITPMEHLGVQAAWQKYVDSAVSKTINAPSNIPLEKVEEVFMAAWKAGCKGLTFYRDGSIQGQVLTTSEERLSPKRPKSLPCNIFMTSIKGSKWCIVVGLLKEKPYEVFAVPASEVKFTPKEEGMVTKTRSGCYKLESNGDELDLSVEHITNEQAEICRLVSLSLRHELPIQFVVEQLEKSSGDMQAMSRAIARCIKKYIPDGIAAKGMCEVCGGKLIRQEGCVRCSSCTWSKCS